MTKFATYDDVKNFIFTTDCNYNKNLSSEDFQFFSAAASAVGAGSYVLRQYTVTLSEVTRHYQLYVNLSIDSGEYYAIPNPDRSYGGGVRKIAVNVSQNGSDLTLNVYLINNSGVSQNFPAFTLNVTRRDFVDEI